MLQPPQTLYFWKLCVTGNTNFLTALGDGSDSRAPGPDHASIGAGGETGRLLGMKSKNFAFLTTFRKIFQKLEETAQFALWTPQTLHY